MSDTKIEDMEATTQNTDDYVLHLPRPLNLEEKKYLLAVERGDLSNVKRLLQLANKGNVNMKSDSIEINAKKLFLTCEVYVNFFKTQRFLHFSERDNFFFPNKKKFAKIII